MTRIFLIFILLNISNFAKEYFVSSSTGSDSNSGTSTQSAWKSLDKLSSILLYPGDIIRFRCGDKFLGYFNLNYGGTSGNEIKFDSYGTGDKPLFEGNITQSYIIKIKRYLSYISINNLSFRNCDAFTYDGRGLIYLENDCSHISILNCKFNHTLSKQTSLDYGAVYSKDVSYFYFLNNEVMGRIQGLCFVFDYSDHSDVHDIIIKNNYFHDLLTRLKRGNAVKFRPFLTKGQSYGKRGDWNNEGVVHDVTFDSNKVERISNIGFKIEENDSAEIHRMYNYNINVRYNTFDLIENCAMDIACTRDRNGHGDWSQWSYNLITNCGFDSLGQRTTSNPVNAIQTHSPRHVKIQYNRIDKVAASSGDASGIIIDYNKTCDLVGDSCIISNNVISRCKYNKNDKGQGINCFTSARNQIYSNIVYDCYFGIIVDNTPSLNGIHTNRDSIYNNIVDNNSYGIFINKSDVYTVIKNNIISNNTIKGFRDNLNSYVIFDYNLFYNNTSDKTDGNNLSGNPNFSDAEAHDYTLLSSSPALTAGIVPLFNSRDFLGNLWKSPYAIGAFQNNVNDIQSVNINVKVFLEGPYSNGKMTTSLEQNKLLPLKQPYNSKPWNYSGDEQVAKVPENIVDWILIELRSTSNVNARLGRKAAFLRNDGKIVDLDGVSDVSFINIDAGNYFIVINHRNHLSIMSSKAVNLSENSSLYDFTTNPEVAYGTNSLVELRDGIYGMYAGDSDGNGIINILDYSLVGNNIFKSEYNNGDLDMNSIININDYNKSSENLFKCSKVPN